MKKIVSALLVAGLLAILLIVGGAHRHTVVKPVAEPEQTADGQDEDVPVDADEDLDAVCILCLIRIRMKTMRIRQRMQTALRSV